MMVVSHDTAAETRPTALGASGSGAVPQALARVKAFIEPRLEKALQLSGEAAPRLLEAMRYSLLAPGKRLRPALVLWAAGACSPTGAQGSSPEIWETAAGAAVAVEMIHAYSLVHDDLPAMDDDDLRRGQPTCHRAYDEATAILCGDALQALAFETLVGSLPAATAARGCRVLAQAAGAEALVGGLSDDLAAERGWLDPSNAPEGREAQVAWMERIHRRKTGALFRASLTLGGLAAGADDQRLAALDGYGQAFGLAFQIADDLLDAEGNEATTGKRVGKDAERGKLTYPTVLGPADSRRRAEALAAEAGAMLADLPSSADDLRHLASWIVTRDH